jgi:hypothetical protein
MSTTSFDDPRGQQSLFQRLTDLEIPTPPRLLELGQSVGPPAHRRSERRRLRRATIALAIAAFLVVSNGLAAYFAPNYAHALADVPVLSLVTAPALRAAGLSAGDVSPLHASGSWSGVTVTLSGSYTDGLQTVLFVDVEGLPVGDPSRPAPAFSLGQIVITDQFGQAYRLVGGEGLGAGPYPMIFEPLRGSAARVGGRLTLHVLFTETRGGAGGEIDLHAAVLAGSDHRLAVPTPQTVAGTTFRIVDLEVSSNSLEVHTVISGALIEADVAAGQRIDSAAQQGRLPAGGAGVCYPGVFVITPSGRFEIPTASLGDPSARLQSDHVLDETRLFARSESGTYRVVVSGAGCSATPPQDQPALASWSINVGG